MLVFGKWDGAAVKISDLSLAKYIQLERREIPHTFGKKRKYDKDPTGIIERLINKVMRSGQGKRKLSGKYIRGRGSCGKKLQAINIMERAFGIIERETKENPLQVLVRAIENAGPREDITRIKRGGISYTVSVDLAPIRRVDESLKNLALAAFSQSFNRKVSAEEALAKEIMLAAKGDHSSFSIKRRDEVERIAKSSR